MLKKVPEVKGLAWLKSVKFGVATSWVGLRGEGVAAAAAAAASALGHGPWGTELGPLRKNPDLNWIAGCPQEPSPTRLPVPAMSAAGQGQGCGHRIPAHRAALHPRRCSAAWPLLCVEGTLWAGNLLAGVPAPQDTTHSGTGCQAWSRPSSAALTASAPVSAKGPGCARGVSKMLGPPPAACLAQRRGEHAVHSQGQA